MHIPRLSLRSTLLTVAAVCCVAAGGVAGCDNTDVVMLPNEYISLAYVVDPPGTSTVERPLVLPIQSGNTMCDRTTKNISVTAASGLAAVTVNLRNTATAPGQLALTANGNTKGIAEVIIKVPTFFDMMGTGSAPQTFDTTVAGGFFTCTLKLPSTDLFGNLDGTFTCSTPSSSATRKLEVSESVIHVFPCPPQ